MLWRDGARRRYSLRVNCPSPGDLGLLRAPTSAAGAHGSETTRWSRFAAPNRLCPPCGRCRLLRAAVRALRFVSLRWRTANTAGGFEASRASVSNRFVRSKGVTDCFATPSRDGPRVTDDQLQGALRLRGPPRSSCGESSAVTGSRRNLSGRKTWESAYRKVHEVAPRLPAQVTLFQRPPLWLSSREASRSHRGLVHGATRNAQSYISLSLDI